MQSQIQRSLTSSWHISECLVAYFARAFVEGLRSLGILWILEHVVVAIFISSSFVTLGESGRSPLLSCSFLCPITHLRGPFFICLQRLLRVSPLDCRRLFEHEDGISRPGSAALCLPCGRPEWQQLQRRWQQQQWRRQQLQPAA